MNSETVFYSPEEEVKHLAAEIRETKLALKAIQKSLSHLETRARRAFPAAYPKPQENSRKSGHRTESVTSEQALSLYDELVADAKAHGIEHAEQRLSSFDSGTLSRIREEVGVPLGGRRPSFPALVDAIIGRIKQSALLTKHVNREVQPPR
jgi:hypothetical protein